MTATNTEMESLDRPLSEFSQSAGNCNLITVHCTFNYYSGVMLLISPNYTRIIINFRYKLITKSINLFILLNINHHLPYNIIDIFIYTGIFWGSGTVRCVCKIVHFDDVLSIFLFNYFKNNLLSFLKASFGVLADEPVACFTFYLRKILW